jgi:hypothetical protein
MLQSTNKYQFIKQNKPMLLNDEYGQSLYNLLEEIK